MKMVLSLTAGLILLPLTAFAAPPAQAPSQAPTQAPVQAPAKTAQANNGYRTYSYEPSAGYRTYSYQPNMGYGYADPYNGYSGRGPAYRTGPAAQGFYRADHKITGPY